MTAYTELADFRRMLDAYLQALADRGQAAVTSAFAEFFAAHPTVIAVRWEQGVALAELVFELSGGALYQALDERLLGDAPEGFDREGCDDFAGLLYTTVDVLTACFGYDVCVRASREGIAALDLAA